MLFYFRLSVTRLANMRLVFYNRKKGQGCRKKCLCKASLSPTLIVYIVVASIYICRKEMSRKYPLLYDKAWLERKYVDEKLKLIEIVNLVGCGMTSVTRALDKNKIPRRTRSEANIHYKELHDKKWLEQKYIDENLEKEDIADLLGCCPHQVLASLKRFDIPYPSSGELHIKYPTLHDKKWLEQKYIDENTSTSEITKIVGCARGVVARALCTFGIPHGYVKPIRLDNIEWLKHAYVVNKRTCPSIAKEIGSSASTVQKTLKDHGVVLRKGGMEGMHHTESAKKGMSEKRKGIVRSEETRRRISESKKGKKNPMYGVTPWNKGKKGIFSEETIQRLREARKHQVFPTHHTKIERILIDVFERNKLPIKYTGDSAFWIETSGMNINPDFIVEGKKIAIEANGEWTHYSLCNYKKRVSSGKAHREKLLRGVGWKLVVFWESDILREDSEAFVLSVLSRRGVV